MLVLQRSSQDTWPCIHDVHNMPLNLSQICFTRLNTEELVMPQDTAAEGSVTLEPSEAERQAEDRVPVERMSDTSILGKIKTHLKVWVTLRRPIGKARRLVYHMILLPCD